MSYNVTVSGTDYSGVDSVKLPITDNDGVYATFVNASITTEIIDGTLTELSNSEATKVLEAKFKGCTNLTKVELPEVTAIYGSAFMNCSKLTDVSVPKWNSNSSMGGGHFQGCTALKEFVCNAKHIAPSCFSGCTSLEFVDFRGTSAGTSAYVGNSSFANCSNLATLILRTKTMATLAGINAFTGSAIESGTGYIYVPSELIDSYKTARYWATFANQFRAIEDYPDICG